MSYWTDARRLLGEEGLSDNAARVYLRLLSMGSANLHQLSSRTRLHPQSVKNALLELSKEDLVTKVGHKLSRTLYKPVPPHAVSKRIHQRHEEYIKILPELQKTFRGSKTRFASIYEGQGVLSRQLISLMEDMCKGDNLDILCHPGLRLLGILGPDCDKIEKLRADKSIKKRSIVISSAIKTLKQRPDIIDEKLSEYKTHKAVDGPEMRFVTKNKTLFYFDDASEPTTLLIEDRAHAEQAQKLFDYLWNESKKI